MELRDLYDENKKLTGEKIYKGQDVPKGCYYITVVVFIQNSKNEFLLQKRVKKKDGKWATTGGHPVSGETSRQGIITEIKEELGLDFSDKNFILFNEGCDGTDCYKMYYVTADIDLNDITIQEEELSVVKWFKLEELENMVLTKELNDNQISCFIKCTNFIKKNSK